MRPPAAALLVLGLAAAAARGCGGAAPEMPLADTRAHLREQMQRTRGSRGGVLQVTRPVSTAKPPMPEEPPAPGIKAFIGGTEGYGLYFFPRLLQTPTGELLVFSEAHVDCACHGGCRGATDIVLKRSIDGSSWSALQVVHSEREPGVSTTIGNPAPLVDAETNTLWLIMSRNNTDVLAMSSQDWGKNWSEAKVINKQVLAPEWRSSKPRWQVGGWRWVATTGGNQLTVGPHKGRLVVSGDVQTKPTNNCSSPGYARQQQQLGSRADDGKSCSQSWVMYSDSHGAQWNYSRTLMLPGDEASNPVQLANGSVILNLRGHDLRSYDRNNPNNAMRWLARSDTSGTTWPGDLSHLRPLINASSQAPMRFGGDCFGDMSRLPPMHQVPPARRDIDNESNWVAPRTELLVMGAIHTTGGSQSIGISGRADFRVHASGDGGNSWTLVSQVYTYSTSYSGIRALNSTHVGVMINVGSTMADSMECGATTNYVVVCVRCRNKMRGWV
jgi:hypothetical protein